MAALQALGADPIAIGDFRPEEVMDLSVENLAAGGNWRLRTSLGRLDVMQHVPGVSSYEELRANSIVPEIPV